MTQSLSGSGQTFCSLRGLSGPLPSAVYAPEMEAEMEVYGRGKVGRGEKGRLLKESESKHERK